MTKTKSIIFVCLGNICRSPIAQGVAEKYSVENNLDIKIESAGTGSWHVGESPCENSIIVAKMNNVDISKQKARQFTTKDIKKYDFIVGLDDSNIENLKNLGVSTVFKLGDFGFEGQDVPDPYFFEGFKGFDKVYEMIDICVRNFMKEKID